MRNAVLTPMWQLRTCALIAWLLGAACSLRADETAVDDFSDRAAIEKRLESAQAELQALPEGSPPELRVSLEQLEEACQYHLGAVDLLTAARAELAAAKQESSAWSGFPDPPPYSVLLLDEAREQFASREADEGSHKAQIRIFKSEIERLQDTLSGHRQAERRFMELAEKGPARRPSRAPGRRRGSRT